MKHNKVKKLIITTLILLIVVVIIILINPIKLFNVYQLKNLNYTDSNINMILDKNLKDEILEIGFNETISKVIESEDFDKDNIGIYKELKYYDLKNYTKNVNKLIEKSYTAEEINIILGKSNEENLEKISEHEYIQNISKFLQFDFSKLSYIDRYITYQNKNNIDNELVVLYVNIGLDKDFYQDVTKTSEFSYDMIINKYHGISKDFTPLNIVDVPSDYGKGEKLNEEALKAFIKMSDDCKVATKYKLLVRSGYRDLTSQEETYNSYLKTYGKTYAENYVTHPGYSEHHTGLAIDIKAESSDVFANSKESIWASENAYKYGFILRYKKEYENITGIKYEAWHYRYVGEEIAKYIHEHEMTYEEYYVRFIENKEV